MQRGYHRRHITGGKPKKLSKADQVLWDEWVELFKSGKTKRAFKFWKTNKKNEVDKMDLIDKYLGERAPSIGEPLGGAKSPRMSPKGLKKEFEKIDWKDFWKMSKDTSGKTFKEYDKKYGKMYIFPHVEDALSKAKDFKEFMKMIKKFEK